MNKLYQNLTFLPNLDTSVKFFSAHMQTVAQGWSTYPDAHRAFEILLILSGTQETIINQKHYFLNAGDILVIPPGMRHLNLCISHAGMTYFTAHFDIDEPALRYTLIKNIPLIFPNEAEENQILRPIIQEWICLYQKTDVFSLSDRILTVQILLKLIFELIRISENDLKNNSDIQSLSLARNIAEIIQHNFQQFFEEKTIGKVEPAIRLIYAEANISASHGLETFKKIYGMSPKKYLGYLKFMEAKRLLTNPEITIENISEKLGYSNPAHFSRQFQKWSGFSPSQYRKNIL